MLPSKLLSIIPINGSICFSLILFDEASEQLSSGVLSNIVFPIKVKIFWVVNRSFDYPFKDIKRSLLQNPEKCVILHFTTSLL